jgi:Protein of unknown function (DUF2917)
MRVPERAGGFICNGSAPAGNRGAAGANDRGGMPTIDLRPGRMVRLPEGPGTTVTACAGVVWITEQDSPHDVVLTAGQSFTLARPGLALVQAFRDASIVVDQGGDVR